jgi:hypothetical protein
VFFYFRNAFPNQLSLRLKSLFSGYYFRELITDFGLSFTGGSLVAGLISTLVQAQAIVLIVVFSGYVLLNSFLFYIMIFIGIVLWRILVFLLQSLQAYILDIPQLARTQTQRQINLDLGFSILFFPIFLLTYYNASLLLGVNVALIAAVALSLWVFVRIGLEFLGMIRERGVSLSGILYFCAFEIMPHALFAAMFRSYSKS